MKKIIHTIVLLLFLGFTGAASANAADYAYSRDLTMGSSGDDVAMLQTTLIQTGYDIPAVSMGISSKGYFGGQTRAALIRYQRSVGLPATGYFGPLTRARIGGTIPESGAPVISGLDAPTALTVNQTGIWTIRVSNPQNQTLSYSIDWGDTAIYPVNTSTNQATNPFVQSSSFTHIYNSAGTYTVRATVMNTAGLSSQVTATVIVTDSAATGPLTVLSPNGAETWVKGTTQNITWNAPAYLRAATVDIRATQTVRCTGQICPMIAYASYVIATGIPANQNSYSWTVGTARNDGCVGTDVTSCPQSNTIIPDGLYTVQICVTGGNACDSSDASFTVSSGTTGGAPDINVVTPNGGETWTFGTPESVTVNISGDEPRIGNAVSLFLIPSTTTDISNSYSLGSFSSGSTPGLKTFQIPAITTNRLPGQYKIYATLSAVSNTQCPANAMCSPSSTMQAYDFSDQPFTLSYAACPIGYTCTVSKITP